MNEKSTRNNGGQSSEKQNKQNKKPYNPQPKKDKAPEWPPKGYGYSDGGVMLTDSEVLDFAEGEDSWPL